MDVLMLWARAGLLYVLSLILVSIIGISIFLIGRIVVAVITGWFNGADDQ